jgi:hypothetical protein
MAISDHIRRGGHDRIASSGVVFSDKLSGTPNMEKTDKGNVFLLRLIEEELELSFRSQHCLNNAGIKLIGQLVQKTGQELLDLKNFGRRSLGEIEEALSDVGLTLEMNLDFPPWCGDGEDAELIQILSQQQVGGGFHLTDNTTRNPGIDLKERGQASRVVMSFDSMNKLPVRHTEHLLHRLETAFEKGRPYLTNLIRRHRKWLQEEIKKASSR